MTITKEQYDRCMAQGYVSSKDEDIFGASLVYGYGVYGATAGSETNPETGETEYYVDYEAGDSCD